MLDNLTQRLGRVVKNLRGQARLTEDNIGEMLREVRMALLEADVALPVVKDFIAKVKEKALGQEVIGSLTPGQALVGVVHRELTELMGGASAGLNLATQPPAVILMSGLQGAGKTTTTAKLGKWLKERQKKKVLTVSCDVYRPAAIEQLKAVSAQAGIDFFPSSPASRSPPTLPPPRSTTPSALLRRDLRRHRRSPGDRRSHDGRDQGPARAAEADRDPVRGRCHAGPGCREYGQGLQRGAAADRRDPDQARRRFARRRGALGAPRHRQADQVRRRRRKADGLEEFHPERMASRILGMGDILGLVEEAQRGVDQEKAQEFVKKMKSGKGFDLNDFKDQIGQMKNMGGMAPCSTSCRRSSARCGKGRRRGRGQVHPPHRGHHQFDDADRAQQARADQGQPQAPHRHRRRGPVQEVNRLLNQFEQTQKMMKQFSKGGMAKMMRGMKGHDSRHATLACAVVQMGRQPAHNNDLALIVPEKIKPEAVASVP
jgi:signal recognition particle subunit SRP54